MIPGRCAAATASLFGAVWGCSAGTESRSTLEGMFPAKAYNDAPLTVLIQGRLFRPSYHFDMMAGAAQTEVGTFSAALTPVADASVSIPLETVTWMSPTALSATIPAGLAAGAYDLSVVDPRGQSVRLAPAFESLGPDDQAPVVTIDAPEPGNVIGAQTKVIVSLTADDGDGWLASLGATVSIGATPLDLPPCLLPTGTHRTPCRFEFIAPAPSRDADTVTIAAWAIDSVGHETRPQPVTFPLAPRPSMTGLSPIIGPAAGGTPIQIHGTDFLASPAGQGTHLLIDGHVVTGATVVSATEMVATTPIHDPGYGRLTVSTGGAESDPFYFEFVAAPIVKMVSPSHGPVTGGTWITIAGNHFRDPQTKIYFFGDVPLPCQRFVSPTRIRGRVPPASAAGPTAIVAVDEPGGSGMLLDAFTYDAVDTEAPDGGVDPTNCEGAP